ncbi:hypothetical protein EV174_003147 [Coemansia sp. RSA 2320]|nr:hypothetical protein EV174_003147 [Coemansia sp. RSA 2320]
MDPPISTTPAANLLPCFAKPDHSAADFCPADYFAALSSVDRSIRSLIDGHDKATSVANKSIISRVDEDSAIADDDHNESAALAFLCSGLPHYEGPAPIFYDDLSTSLEAYCRVHPAADPELIAAAEERIPDDSWDIPRPPLVRSAAALVSPLSPQTLAGSPRDAGLSTYEGWIDFEEMLAAVHAALSDDSSDVAYTIGARSETDHMVYYAVESDRGSAVDQNDESERWAVQIPKPAVPQGVFESEIISLAYVNEHAELPVSQILAYDFSPSNVVGVPYAIVSVVPGDSLADHWHSLLPRQKRKVLDQIADYAVQLSTLQFPLIGSLVAGDGKLEIGPLLDVRQSEPGYAQLSPTKDGQHRYGPFSTTTAYYHAMINASIDALRALYRPHSPISMNCSHAGFGEPSLDQIELEAYATFVDRFVVTKYDQGPFVLMPESLDLHHFNFDRRTCRLLGLVDWTYSSVRPFTTLIQPPSFTFDDTPRWEPHLLQARMAYRRNLVRYRQWFMSGLQKRAWAAACDL